jgi:hypothetical protein
VAQNIKLQQYSQPDKAFKKLSSTSCYGGYLREKRARE